MKASKRSNDKKINTKPKDLTPNKNPRGGTCRKAGGDVNFSRPRSDGLSSNHNEMFLADVS
jgi:hypothetical protein